MIRNISRYQYTRLEREDTSKGRMYHTPEKHLVPSVTTILSKTKSAFLLDNWKRRVGAENAKKIATEASTIGTAMHKFLEHYVEETTPPEPNTDVARCAKSMADVILNEGLKYVDEIWGSEVQLYYKDQYAGTADLIGMYKGVPHIIDFKQTNKPKKEEWIQDYFLQLTAYGCAHNYMHNTDIKSGVVLMCSRNLEFQKFEINDIQFEKYSYMWFNRVNDYYKMIEATA